MKFFETSAINDTLAEINKVTSQLIYRDLFSSLQISTQSPDGKSIFITNS